MPYAVRTFQETPNPNAVKCILDRPIRDASLGPASFRTPAAAGDDPAARALFQIPGVTSLLINADWITVNKAPTAEWKKIKSGVSSTLAELP